MSDATLFRSSYTQENLSLFPTPGSTDALELENLFDFYIPGSFYELVFCQDVVSLNQMGCYSTIAEMEDVRKIKRAAFPKMSLDGLFENSFGVAIWDYQVDNMLSLVIPVRKDRQKYLDALNTKEAPLLAEMDQMAFPWAGVGVSLLEAVETKMLFPRWTRMGLKAAIKLWDRI